MHIEGVPDGVEPVKFSSIVGPEEFELVGHGDKAQIIKGGRPGAMSHVIVKPKEGYLFRTDILGHYAAEKKLAQPKKFAVRLSCETESDVAYVKALSLLHLHDGTWELDAEGKPIT